MGTDARIAAAPTLAAEARLLEATIAHMDQGLLVVDRDLNLVLWNRRYQELCNIPADFLRVGMPVVEIVRFLVQRGEFGPPSDGLLDERLDVLRNPQVNSEYHLQQSGITVRINRHPLPEGGSVSTLTDVTRERLALARAEAAEKAAEAAHAHLMTALDASPQGFALFDADDRLVVSNRQYLSQFPFLGPNDSIVGWTFEKIVDTGLLMGSRPMIPGEATSTSPAAWKAWRLAIHRNPPAEPVVYQRYDGRWFMVSEKRMADGGIVMVRIDVTDLKQAEQDLRAARDEAETAGRAKDEFLASMSHELRTPLNAIMGFAEILKGEMFGPLGQARYKGYAQDILTSATYLLELIRDILDMSKIEAGRMDIDSAPIEVGPEIDRCTGMVRGSARSAGLSLETRVSPDLPKVRADSRALRQILLNLLSNAIKFTPFGGRITVSAALHEDRVRIAIADTGIGIPAWALPRLGRPFEQVDNVLQRKRPGSGLGLALSRSFAELMEGTLEIESTEGKGTTVTLSLSIADPRATE